MTFGEVHEKFPHPPVAHRSEFPGGTPAIIPEPACNENHPMAFNGRTPAEYVEFLTQTGIQTHAGLVPITSYVSTGGRSPHAAAVLGFFNQLLNRFSDSSVDYTIDSPRRRPRAYPGAGSFREPITPHSTVADGLNALEQVRERVRGRGGERASNWRRVFTGQGTVENIQDVMNFIVDNQEMLMSVAPIRSAGRTPFSTYLTGSPSLEQGLMALRRMVTDEIFGLDCLGFTGSYLVWCGMVERYPEWDQSQYVTQLQFEPVASVAEFDARCVVLWLETGTKHIAYIDTVNGRDPSGATVTICQSSEGGPQTNTGVRLVPLGSRYTQPGISALRFNITGGSPPLPVTGPVIIGKRARW